MKTITELNYALEMLNARKNEILNSGALSKKGYNELSDELWREFMQIIKVDIPTIEAHIKDLELKLEIDNINAFNTKVNNIVIKLLEYKKDFVTSNCKESKHFTNFIKSLELDNIYVNASQINSLSSIYIEFRNNNGLKEIINVDNLHTHTLITYDFETVKKQRELHNKILVEFKLLEKRLMDNYIRATANNELHHFGINYTF